MAKKHNHTPQPPAPAPGAAETAPVQSADPAADPQTTTSAEPGSNPEPAPKAKTKTRAYRVNWHLSGFLGKEFHTGDTVHATEAEAAPYLSGVLSLDEDEA